LLKAAGEAEYYNIFGKRNSILIVGDKENKFRILLFNPRSQTYKARLPNSILQVAASVEGKFAHAIVDGNLEDDPWPKIEAYLSTGSIGYFACTVMPGPQLKQAIPYSRRIRDKFPSVKIIWGGYFPSNQPGVVLRSGYVDFIVNGMGDKCFPELITRLEEGRAVTELNNLIYLREGEVIINGKDPIYDQDLLPSMPYASLDRFYSIPRYLGKSYLGSRTIAYHSSFGCPFTCSFCAVVPIYQARWKGKSASLIYKDIKFLKDKYGADAIEFHDNNFFVSEKRAVEFARLVMNENMSWWGEARIDTMDKYSDESLRIIREAGCKMIFFGAETGNDEVLKKMDKGGTQNAAQIESFAARLRKFDIIPEYSFVLGTPADTEEEVNRLIDQDIAFIRRIKEINPATEIIIYTYSPVPAEGSEMYEKVKASGFRFPERLEDWISSQWENFDLRKNPLTPWLKPYMIDKIRDFETVLNAYYPTVSDIRLGRKKRRFLRVASSWRYGMKFYTQPKELRLFQVLWKYRQPEKEGF
jgi:anaerobic magnesium-protoporphyrin IX monomethyl ester cyclase